MKNENNHRQWLTVVSCPHCRNEHEVHWPYGSFPGGNPRYRFECPTTSMHVVFPTTVVWGKATNEPE